MLSGERAVSVPFVQIVMIALLVRRKSTLQKGWIEAGITRRATTAMWASGFLMENRSLGGRPGKQGIELYEMFPNGVQNATREDVAKLHDHLGCWLDFWSAKHPDDTLDQAMLNLIIRLLKAKDSWVAEREDDFPFYSALHSAYQGNFEEYVVGKA
jgi:hypothetical protein